MLISSLASVQIKDISFNENHSMALSTNNQVYSWGFNLDGALGIQFDGEYSSTPLQINSSLIQGNIEKICTGKYNSGIISEYCTLVSGRNDDGCLGLHQQSLIIHVFSQIKIQDETIKDISFGNKFHTLILTSNQKVYGVGNNQKFQLGTGNNQPVKQPKEIQYLRDKKIKEVKAGDYSMSIDENGQVYVWGIGNILIPNPLFKKKINVDQIELSQGYIWMLLDDQKLFNAKVKDLIYNDKNKKLIQENVVRFSVGKDYLVALGVDLESTKNSIVKCNQSQASVTDYSLAGSSNNKKQNLNQSTLSIINSPALTQEHSFNEINQSPRSINNPARSISPLINNQQSKFLGNEKLQQPFNFEYKDYYSQQNIPKPYSYQFDDKENLYRNQDNRYNSVSPIRPINKTPESNYFKDKERLLKEQITSQEIQISFLKEKLARQEVQFENERRDLQRKVQGADQKLQLKEQHVENQEVKLLELREQVQMVQEHYQNMQDIMKRDQNEKEKYKEEFIKYKKDNKILKEQNMLLNDKIMLMEQQIQELAQENIQLSQLKEVHQEYTKLDNYAQEINQLNEQAKDVICQQEQEISSLNEKLNQMQLMVDDSQAKRDSQKQIIKNLKDTNMIINQTLIKYKYKIKNLKEQKQIFQHNEYNSKSKSPQIRSKQMIFNNQKHLVKLFEECMDKNNKENTHANLFDISSQDRSKDRIHVQLTRNNNNLSNLLTSDDHSNQTQDTNNNNRQEKSTNQNNHNLSQNIIFVQTDDLQQVKQNKSAQKSARSEMESTFNSVRQFQLNFIANKFKEDAQAKNIRLLGKTKQTLKMKNILLIII
ncbi:UNKNOWN [Stylonychia lemnae]|uniref:Regulator of chromosome condensation n=1 Tax=Stylonychia lemnae TaxID=5949 RepID=A0A078AQU8_STYLE|nr:UNKNOWN [Stylonychia lemnae]|eukprot:CDW84311.1 UNKNOWN [Stylonychia lemnae]